MPPKGTTGSIGPFVRLSDGRVGFVSAGFVLAPDGAKSGDHIHQPGALDTEILTGATRVGTLGPFVRAQAGRQNRVDAAIAILHEAKGLGNVAPEFSPDSGRAISGSITPGVLSDDDVVAFAGRTSGFSEGVVNTIEFMNLSIELGSGTVSFDGCIEVVRSGSNFCEPGDAGALVWRRSDMKAVGLVFAATHGENGEQYAYVMPIADVSTLEVGLTR